MRGATPEKEKRPIALPAEPLKCGVVWTRLLPTLRPTPYALRRSYSERLSKIDEHHRVKIDGQIESHLRFALSLCESAKRKRARASAQTPLLLSHVREWWRIVNTSPLCTLHTTLPASRPPGLPATGEARCALRGCVAGGRAPGAGRLSESLPAPEGDRDRTGRGIAIRIAGSRSGLLDPVP